MGYLAVIPARGGSKRIPRKNIRNFFGKPMIAYSIQGAIESGVFDRIIVSTDDEEIATVARSYGADVPFLRPSELSDDHMGITEVVAHAVDWVRRYDQDPESVCCIFATAPLIQKEDIKKGLDIMERGAWQYVFSATSFGFPIFRSFKMKADHGLEMFFPEHFKTRSQDLPHAMQDAGQFYWGRSQAWIDGLRLFDQWSTVVELPRWRVQDIDTIEDWKNAEMIYRFMQGDETNLMQTSNK